MADQEGEKEVSLLKKLHTRPVQILDLFFWPVLRVFWEPFSRKNSHWWHWVDYHGEIISPLIVKAPTEVAGEKSRQTRWDNFYQTNFGWQTAVVVEPVDHKGFYRLGFVSKSEGRQQYCAILLTGSAAALVASEEVKFFALDYFGCQVPLKVVRFCPKSKLDKNIVLV